MPEQASEQTSTTPWTGGWVAGRLNVHVTTTCSPVGVDLTDLVGLAVRRNPRRAHLLVSTVLGKHVPADPRLVYGTGLLLGALARDTLAGSPGVPGVAGVAGADGADGAELIRAALAGQPGAAHDLVQHAHTVAGRLPTAPEEAMVLGYAETATALGHAVADALEAPVIHSTRRPIAGAVAFSGFEEEHSHATSHLLLPENQSMLTTDGPLVLVDDELSTGATALNTIAALHATHRRDRYVIATLVDLRSDADRDRMAKTAADLGTTIDVVALAVGRVDLPEDVLRDGQRLVAQTETHQTQPPARRRAAGDSARIRRVHLPAPAGLRDGGRHGFSPQDRVRLEAYLRQVGAEVVGELGPARRVHVLGFEELMYAPLRLAEHLSDLLTDRSVTYSTTTRSPVLAVPDDDYAIRSRLVFPAHDDPADGPGDRFAYNLTPTATDTDDGRFDAIVLVVDAAGDTLALAAPDGLLSQLADLAPVVLVVLDDYRPGITTREAGAAVTVRESSGLPARLPTPLYGLAFGSYPAPDVAWLLKDLSHAALEAPTEEREEAIQSGGAHYAESLPVEYQPTPAYQDLFTRALEDSAERIAYAVGLVTEHVLDLRGPEVVLASLARAGTPIGVLMRRWAQFRHGIDPPHYAVSIVRGRGIDHTALRYLAAHHDPAKVMFVDGWTGKGAITRELAASIEEANAALGTAFSAQMAVLADTGRCVDIFGTREDFLIPSACLNSTVSGLVSRTVLNDTLIGAGDFHGAKYYAELADADVSAVFVDTIAACFPDVAARVVSDLPEHLAADRTPTWAGWAAVERVSAEYGIGDVNLVKPGVGETTRVLLRRVPWKILVRADAAGDLAHVALLAEQRGVDVVELPASLENLPYNCVGLIHPKFTRGATGADGTAASDGTTT